MHVLLPFARDPRRGLQDREVVVRRSTAYAALVGFGLSVVMNLATFGGVDLIAPSVLLLPLGMGYGGGGWWIA